MTKIGVVGMGKLGLPCALAIESKGFEVRGYDPNPEVAKYISSKEYPFKEEGIEKLIKKTKIKTVKNVREVVQWSDIVFVPVQTPHEPRFEGTERLPQDRADFDYSHLIKAIADISADARLLRKHVIVAVISTCLPGTFRERIKPLLNEFTQYVYTPQFIAMGTVIDDYLNPEFNLIGVEGEKAAKTLSEFYAKINDAPNLETDVTTAEAIKVSYNTFITMKTVLANVWGEMAERLDFNIDDLTKAWSLSTKRLLSPRYLKAGMGDGGGCHPRDNIALSYIARKVGMSHNIWEDLMAAREDYEDWHARLAMGAAKSRNLPLIILGKSFKPETDIETGSPAILMANIIQDYGFPFEHYEDLDKLPKAVYFIATQHEKYKTYKFPKGSVVMDTFRYLD